MDWDLIQSASIAATKTALQDSSYDVLWEHSWEAGYLPANSYVRIAHVSNELIGRPHVRFVNSGSGVDAVILEKEWQDRQLTLQFSVNTLYQTLSSSAPAVASEILGRYTLTPVLDVYKDAGMTPVEFGPFIDNSEVGDRDRTLSQGTFEVTFNVTSYKTINVHSLGAVAAVEISGALSGSAGQEIHNVDLFVTAAYFSSSQEPITGIMDHGTAVFNWESSKTVNFNFVFPDDPDVVVLYLVDDVDDSGGVYLQGTNYNSASFTMEASAPFSGTIGYRAVWSNLSPSYPATVTSSLHSSSGVLSTSVGSVHTQNFTGTPKVSWSADYFALDQTPTDSYATHWSYGYETGIPVIQVDGFSEDEASGSFDAPLVMDDGGAAGKVLVAAFVSGAV